MPLKFKCLTICALLSSGLLHAQDNGLAPEVTDLNAKDVSIQQEAKLPYLEKAYISTKPTNMNDGIEVGELGIDGGNKEKILAFTQKIINAPKDTKHSTDSLLIAYKGKLIFESYYRRGRVNYPHYQMSYRSGFGSSHTIGPLQCK